MDKEEEQFPESNRGKINLYDLLVSLEDFTDNELQDIPVTIVNKNTGEVTQALEFIPILNIESEKLRQKVESVVNTHTLKHKVKFSDFVSVFIV